MNRILVLGIILLVFVFRLRAERYSFARLNSEDGLSGNTISAICKDSKGFIWIGTQHGLNRFDGYGFKQIFSIKGDSTSLKSNIIKDIQADIQGNLWIQNNNQLVVYDRMSERILRDPTPLLRKMDLDPLPAFIEIDQNKNFYAYYKNIGIYKYNPLSGSTTIYQQTGGENGELLDGRITGLKTDKEGFWVLFKTGYLQHFYEEGNLVDMSSDYLIKQNDKPQLDKQLFVDREGDVWIYPGLYDNGVLCFSPQDRKWTSWYTEKNRLEALPNYVNDVSQDSEGRIWIASNHGGIIIHNKQTGTSVRLLYDHNDPASLSQNSTTTLFADPSGIMWVGTYKNGISYYHPDLFKFENAPAGFFNHPDIGVMDCNCFCEDRNGNLWIGTDGGGLIRYSGSSGTYTVFKTDEKNPNSISSNVIVSLACDSSGDIWIGTYFGGLNRFDGHQFFRYQKSDNNPNSLSNNSVYGICEDGAGRLWLATLGGGMNCLDQTRRNFTRYDRYNDGLLSNYINDLFITPDRSQILINSQNGVNLLDVGQLKITALFTKEEALDKFSDVNVNCSLFDTRGLLWLGSNNGINIFERKTGKVYFIGQSQGLPNLQISTMVEDHLGNIWVGTTNGLACIYPRLQNDQDYTFPVVGFDRSDGISSSSFNRHAVFKTSGKKIIMGTTNGYLIIDPSKFQITANEPRIIFTDLIIGGKTIQPGERFHNRIILPQTITEQKEISMNHTVKNFSVCFSTLNYLGQEKVRFKYRLDGLNTDWTELIGQEGRATFSNLNPGNYSLVVYAANSQGEWGKTPSVLKIKIIPPFWRTGWAYLTYLVLLLSSVTFSYLYFFLKAREKYQNRQKIMEIQHQHDLDEMKLSFFTNISHEFRTPLSLILNPAEKLLKEVRSEEERSMLTIIHRNAVSLLELVNQLLDFRKLDAHTVAVNLSAGDVVAFIRDICNSFIDMANQKRISLAFSSSVNELNIEFDQEKLKKIIINLLSNAFKFTENQGKIEINLSIIQILNDSSNVLKISVSDTGIGIEKENFGRIFERFTRIENHRGESQPGTGIGLHIVNEYVKLLNGSIQIESSVGKGSTFTLTLPIGAAVPREMIFDPGGQTNQNQEDNSEEVSDSVEELREMKNRPLIMVVDDNPDFRHFMVMLLRPTYRVLSAANGKSAHQMVLEHIPDLIISDVMMPELDGFELCRIVKEDVRTSHIPVILLTAKNSDESRYEGLKSGADDYIAKPFNTELLSLKVAQMMERQQKLQHQLARKIDINLDELEVTDLNEEFLKKAVHLVDNNLSDPEFSIESMSRELGMSRAYLYKKMQTLIGKSPTEFVRHIRLQRAATLLEKSGMIVKEVAFQVGFNDTKYFRKYFKEEFGLSPNDFRKKFWAEK